MRKLQIVKLRGQASVPGLHTFRITHAGASSLFAYPWAGRTSKEDTQYTAPFMGIPELDKMLGGGHP